MTLQQGQDAGVIELQIGVANFISQERRRRDDGKGDKQTRKTQHSGRTYGVGNEAWRTRGKKFKVGRFGAVDERLRGARSRPGARIIPERAREITAEQPASGYISFALANVFAYIPATIPRGETCICTGGQPCPASLKFVPRSNRYGFD
jgi:hypothetical protein